MKIVHVINSLETGGAEGALVRLATNDTENQHVVVSLKKKCGYDDILENLNVKVYFLNFGRIAHFLSDVLELRDIILKEQPEVIQSWMYHSNLICSFVKSLVRQKVDLYWNIRHSTVSLRHDKFTQIILFMVCAVVSRILKVNTVYCAHAAMDFHIRMGFSKHHNTVIGNGYPLYIYDLPNSHKFKSNDDTFLIGYFGRYHRQKNHLKLFEAVRSLKDSMDIRLILAGKGCENKNHELVSVLKKMDLQSNVLLKGVIVEPRWLMHKCDYTVLVSDYGEGFPNVIGESLSVGTPCITTDVGDAKVILKNCGNLVKTDSTQDLIEQLKAAWKVRKNFSKYQDLRRKCLENYHDSLTIEDMVISYRQLWQKNSPE